MIEKFYEDNYTRLVNHMANKLAGNRNVAEDVVQEAFTKAIKFQHAYDEKRGKYSTWFNRILYGVLSDHQKDHRNSPEQAVEECTYSDVFDNNHPMSQELSKEIRKRIYSMSNLKHKDILEMFFVYGFTSKEIPYMLEGVTQTNVNVVVKRFRDGL